MKIDLQEKMSDYLHRQEFGGPCDALCDLVPNTYHRATCAGATLFCEKHDIHYDENKEEMAPDKIFYTTHATADCTH